MKNPGDKEAPRKDGETRRRSAEQRNVTAPTPRDVREKAEEHGAADSGTGSGTDSGAGNGA
ncbi:hypothetical protein ACIPSE_24655 [Streptomyces sp. NPDC090106]|uniref:hypothetical protein n=1 Tax=Streptomyces sp. NPDC090106 TaxID=3365946 RepID=UPI0037F18CE3